MRILLAAQFLPPDIGGEERHVANLAIELANRGHHVAVATQLLNGTAPFEVWDSGVRVHRLRSSVMDFPRLLSDEGRPHHAPVPDPKLRRGLAAVIAQERPQVVHAHNWVVNSLLSLRRDDLPLVLTLHDYSHVCATKRLMVGDAPCSGPSALPCMAHAYEHYGLTGPLTAAATRVMHGWKSRRIDHIVAVSSAVAQANRLPRGRVPWSIVPNFIPAELSDLQAHAAPVNAWNDGEPYLLFAGDLSREKGLDFLLDAYSQLPATRPRLLCVGRRTESTPTHLPDGAVIEGPWSHDRLMAVVRGCEVAVFPSIWPDPCPTTVLEAMASGRPVITTSTGGMPDMVVNGLSGLLVAPGDVAALRDALGHLLGDPARAGQLGAAARLRAAEFAAPVIAARLEEIYASVDRRRQHPASRPPRPLESLR